MEPADETAVPRAAATLLVVRDDPFEVLMLRRQGPGTFPSALVFPGGAVDPDDSHADWVGMTRGGATLDTDDRAFRIAAVRETWEEAGILVALEGARVPADPRTNYRAIVAGVEARLDLDGIHDFAHWVTPEPEPRRFDTRFFIARAPQGQVASFDGNETVSLQWTSPRRAVELDRSGEVPLLFPTRLNLARLAESDGVDAAIDAAITRPRFTVRPMAVSRPGGIAVLIPLEAGYGSVEGFIPAR